MTNGTANYGMQDPTTEFFRQIQANFEKLTVFMDNMDRRLSTLESLNRQILENQDKLEKKQVKEELANYMREQEDMKLAKKLEKELNQEANDSKKRSKSKPKDRRTDQVDADAEYARMLQQEEAKVTSSHSTSSRTVVDPDEELARSLQAQFDKESTASTTPKASATGTGEQKGFFSKIFGKKEDGTPSDAKATTSKTTTTPKSETPAPTPMVTPTPVPVLYPGGNYPMVYRTPSTPQAPYQGYPPAQAPMMYYMYPQSLQPTSQTKK